MKNIYRVFVCVGMLALSSSIFAAKSMDFCPPLSVIKSLKFVDAEQQGKYWLLASEIFKYKDERWFLIMGTKLKSTTVEQALQEGQLYFRTKARLLEPFNYLDVFCGYNEDEDDNLILSMKVEDGGLAKSAAVIKLNK